MVLDDDLKALSGMFADVEPKPVVVQTPEPLEAEEPYRFTGPSGTTIAFSRLNKSFGMMGDSIQKMGRSLKSMPGGIGVDMMVIDDCEILSEEAFKDAKIRFLEMGTNGNHDGLHYITRHRIQLPKIPKNKAEIEAFKTKSRGRLIGRKGW